MYKSIVGMTSSVTAVGITLTEMEQTLRIAGSIIALAIGVVTLYQMLKKKKPN